MARRPGTRRASGGGRGRSAPTIALAALGALASLDGPGNVEVLDLALTLDGRRSHVRSVHRVSWSGGAPAGAAHTALQGVATALEKRVPSRVE